MNRTFLDEHPYTVIVGDGHEEAHYSNAHCAAKTALFIAGERRVDTFVRFAGQTWPHRDLSRFLAEHPIVVESTK